MPTINKLNSRQKAQTLSVEKRAETVFRAHKARYIKELGRGPQTNTTLDMVGRRDFGQRWLGVFSQEQITEPLPFGRVLILNSSRTARSPGYHWMGVVITESGRWHYFDSFARPSNRMLTKRVRKNAGKRIIDSDSTDAEQRGSSAVCGVLSLAYIATAMQLGVRAADLI